MKLLKENLAENQIGKRARDWIISQTIALLKPSYTSPERALANAVARQHEEKMRMKALELSLGIQRNDDWSRHGR